MEYEREKRIGKVGLTGLALLICFLGVVGLPAAYAKNMLPQENTVKVDGTVRDATGETIIGATVLIKGTTVGAATGVDGTFSLNIPVGAILQVSFVGYKSQEIVIKDQRQLNITLLEDKTTLDEVVVTGYGGIQKTKTMTGAAVNVKVQDLVKLPVTSMSQGLGGRVTGIVTQERSGMPGEPTKIWIRGGSKVLYVIDDVVMETEQGEIFFNRLRPDDIASMSILKDASATAIYGPRANDGVVVVATKKGVEGAVDITINQKISIMTPSYRPKVMSAYQYAQWRNEVESANYQETPTFSPGELAKYYMGELNQQGTSREEMMQLVNNKYNLNYSLSDINDLFDPNKTTNNIQDYYTTCNPWDQFDHTQPLYQTNVSVRGGSDRIKYYSSVGYMNQKGISSSFGYEQINVMLNTDAYILKDKSLKFILNLNGNTSTQKKPAGGEGIFYNAMYGDWMPRKGNEWSTGLPRKDGVASLSTTGFDDKKDYRLQANMGLKYNLPWVEGLAVSGTVNFNTSYTMNKAFNHDQTDVYDTPIATAPSPYNGDNSNVYQSWNNYLLTTGIVQVDYGRSFGKHNIFAMVNYQSQVRNTNNTNTKAKGYPSIFNPQISAGATFDSHGGGESKWGSSSYIGRITYDYANKYLLQYSANMNGSLSYSPDKRWGFFQAVSAGWVLTEENFIKDNISRDILSMFKIRAGYGIVGGEIGNPFSYLNQYAQEETKVLIGENMDSQVAWKESQVASDLTWSKSRQISGGVDFGLFNDRLTGSFDTYLYMNNGASMDMNPKMIRTDILGMPNIPQINAPFETTRKGGFEVAARWDDKIGGEFRYYVGLNYSYWDERTTRHTNESTNYYYSRRQGLGLRDMQSEYDMTYVSNGLFGSFSDMYNSLLHSDRNYAPGTFRLVDVNHDGVVSAGDVLYQNKPGSTPLTMYGVTLGGAYKGFELELFFQGAKDVTGSMPSPLRSQLSYMWNYGQYAGDLSYSPSNPDVNASLPMASDQGQGWGWSSIDRWIYNSSYLKLKNISLRYDMKKVVLNHVDFIKALELSFVATNVFTWTNKQYPLKNLADPEYITTDASQYWTAEGRLGNYPTQRSFTLGLTLTL